MHTVRKLVAVAVVMVLTLAGPALASSAPAERVAVAPTTLNYYESPCAHRARTIRGIPPLTADQSRGLIAWERSHAGTATARSYHAALDACPQVARWDWGSMTLAYTEQVGR